MYRITVKRSAQKELLQITEPFQSRIVAAIDGLADNPRPAGVKKLLGDETYRIRVGDYRIVYGIAVQIQIVEIQHIGHRGDVYKRR